MATHLTITPELTTAGAETLSRDWSGWGREVAASVMRGRAHALGGEPDHELPLARRHREAGIASVRGEWTDPDRAASGGVS